MSNEQEAQDSLHEDIPPCLNCNEPLRGQYCANCGQRSTSRLISLWQLLKEAFGDLFEADSRIWQTLGPLLFRPGKLTKEYLQGRRARYMPPFRTYLVLSIIFFVVASFNPREDFSLLFEPPPATSNEEIQEEPDTETDDIDFRFNIDFDDEQTDDGKDNCDIDDADLEGIPEWILRRFTKERLVKACEQARLDDGRSVFRRLVDNIPIALIVLLPMMALVLKILYPLSRRYFVEHLLFFVHFHAFFFCVLTLQILFQRLMAMLSIPVVVPILAIVATSFYVPVYLYIAMRRVYGQGHLVTITKYIVLFTAYLTGASLTLLGAITFAFFDV